MHTSSVAKKTNKRYRFHAVYKRPSKSNPHKSTLFIVVKGVRRGISRSDVRRWTEKLKRHAPHLSGKAAERRMKKKKQQRKNKHKKQRK